MNALAIAPKLGTIEPRMGTKSKQAGLADALFSTTQQRVLGLLFGQPDRSFYAREVIALAGAGGSGAIQRELARLERSRLITSERRGSQKYYQANSASPLFEELSSIAAKTFAIAEPLRAALKPLAQKITAAFVYGSVAKRQDTARSDVDLMVISDTLDYPSLVGSIYPLNERLGRVINPTIFKRAEFAKRMRDGSGFVTRVRSQPKLWIIGAENDLPAG